MVENIGKVGSFQNSKDFCRKFNQQKKHKKMYISNLKGLPSPPIFLKENTDALASSLRIGILRRFYSFTCPENRTTKPTGIGSLLAIHPGRLTWNIIMEVWKIIFLSKWVICRFHVNLPGCKICKSAQGTLLQPTLASVQSDCQWMPKMRYCLDLVERSDGR